MPLLFIGCYIFVSCQASKATRQVPAGPGPGGLPKKASFFYGKSRFKPSSVRIRL